MQVSSNEKHRQADTYLKNFTLLYTCLDSNGTQN